jgi:uncharacterized membrane protein
MPVVHVNFRAQAAASAAMTPELVAKALTKAAEQIEAYAKAADLATQAKANLELRVAELQAQLLVMTSRAQLAERKLALQDGWYCASSGDAEQ